MRTQIRVFNEQGVERFRAFIAEAREGDISGFPEGVLTSAAFAEFHAPFIQIDSLVFDAKAGLVKYIYDKLAQAGPLPFFRPGLWTWLSAFFFESICPVREGRRKVLEDAKYILDTEDWKKYHRHLIAAPVRLYSHLGDLAKIYLAGEPYRHGDLLEQLSSRQEIAVSKGVIEAATKLYWDEDKQKIKRGVISHRGPGVLRRFVQDIIPQFQLTYDLNSMNGDEIISLLPPEFEKWLQ